MAETVSLACSLTKNSNSTLCFLQLSAKALQAVPDATSRSSKASKAPSQHSKVSKATSCANGAKRDSSSDGKCNFE